MLSSGKAIKNSRLTLEYNGTKMGQGSVPLFGLLVSAPLEEEHFGIPEEGIIMEKQINSIMEKAACYLAEKRGFHQAKNCKISWLRRNK